MISATLFRCMSLIGYITQLVVMIVAFSEIRPGLGYSYALSTAIIYTTTWFLHQHDIAENKKLAAELSKLVGTNVSSNRFHNV